MYLSKPLISWKCKNQDCVSTWKCKKQDRVSKSSTKAEYNPLKIKLKKIEAKYCSMSSAFFEIPWLHGLLSKVGFAQNSPMPLNADNTSSKIVEPYLSLVYKTQRN